MKGQVNTDTSSKTTDLLTFSLTDVISSRFVAYYMSIGHGALVLTLSLYSCWCLCTFRFLKFNKILLLTLTQGNVLYWKTKLLNTSFGKFTNLIKRPVTACVTHKVSEWVKAWPTGRGIVEMKCIWTLFTLASNKKW